MRTGFAKAEAEGFSHAVTIDTDGQLDPEQIPDLLRAAGDNRHALVLGRRSDLLVGNYQILVKFKQKKET